MDDSSRADFFARLIEECGDYAYNFAFRLTGNEPDASDLVQSAFMKAFENLSSYDTSKPFQPWLNRILRNLYVDSVKRYEKSHVVSLDKPILAEDQSWSDILPGSDPDPLDQLRRAELEGMVQSAISRLEIEYRAPLVLADIEGLSYEAIAQTLECPIGTVRSRIHRARLQLKEILERLMQEGGRTQ